MLVIWHVNLGTIIAITILVPYLLSQDSATHMKIRGVTIHRCIAMHRYFVTTIRIDTANPVYRYSQETIYTGILERD